MRILHTADWHLGDRLKQIDRTADLERAVQHVADCCERHQVEVLVIAGDLLSELVKPESLQSSIAHLSRTFRPFLLRGGTIIAIAGNHDNDIYCETLRRAFQLAAPSSARPGDLLPGGRLYLVTRPVHFQLADRDNLAVQFLCLPYPTVARYLPRGSSRLLEDFRRRSEALQSAWKQQLRTASTQLDPRLARVLVAHINLIRCSHSDLHHAPFEDDVTIDDLSWRATGRMSRSDTCMAQAVSMT